MNNRIAPLWLLWALILFAQPAAADPVRSDYIEVELIAEVVSIQAGSPFWAAVRLKPYPHWQTCVSARVGLPGWLSIGDVYVFEGRGTGGRPRRIFFIY